MPPRRRPTAPAEPPPPSPPPLDGLEPTALAPLEAEEARTETAACPFCGGVVTPADERCPRCAAKVVPPHAKSIDAIRGNARTVYVFQALALLCGVPAVPGLIMAYTNRGAARDTWLDSHCEWQIDTFWGMFWFWLSGITVLFVGDSLLGDGILGHGPGALVMFAAYAWYIGRLVKGWTRLSDGDPVTDY
ncbi:MAG: DUF4870 family protein [Longimicrobiaceae bacterium]